MRAVLIHVCVTCRREFDDQQALPAGSRLRDAVASMLQGVFEVRGVECLGNCRRSCSVALSAPGSWTYIFGDLAPEAAADLAAAGTLLAHSDNGFRPWRGRPESFKRGMIARVPPALTPKEAAE